MAKYHLDRCDICAMFIILGGTLLRLIAIGLGWPAAYNDEGTVGLMALHVAYKGAHPLLYYGQDYMGSLEAYLGAAFFHLFGPSTFSLRLGLLVLFALFLLCLYLLTTLLYSKSLAIFTLLLLSLGSPDVIFRQLMAASGPPDYFFFTTLLLLLTTWLVFTSTLRGLPPNDRSNSLYKTDWRRIIAYTAWGIIAGLDIWSHLLCLPFVCGAGLLLFLFCRHELRFSAISLLLICLLLGMSPLLIYEATVPVSPQENSLFLGAFGGGYREPSYPAPHRPQVKGASSTSPGEIKATISPKPIPPVPGLQIAGTILVSIPVATNGIVLCPLSSQDAWPLTDQMSPYTMVCTGVHGAWGLGFLTLWCLAVIGAVRQIRLLRQMIRTQEDSRKLRRELALHAVRLVLLLSAGSTLLAFLLYPQAAAVTPWNSARYLIGLLIIIPAILSPLWNKSMTLKQLSARKTYGSIAIRYSLFLLLLGTCLFGTITLFTTQVAQARAGDQQQYDLITQLLRQRATYVYTDYDDCNRLAFLSNERIICAALDKGLQPGLDRYYPYRQMVAQAPHPLYVLVSNSDQAILFEQKAAEQHITYKKTTTGRYTIYDPARHILT